MSGSPTTEAVVAGTKAFAVALLAPVTSRVGTRPRIAADAAQALALCRGPGGVVVIEYLGEGSLEGIRRLVSEGGGLRVVAALAPEHAAAEPSLRALGVEPARWDGRPDAVLGALERLVGGASAPAAAGAPALVPPQLPPIPRQPPPPAPPPLQAVPAPPPLARMGAAQPATRTLTPRPAEADALLSLDVTLDDEPSSGVAAPSAPSLAAAVADAPAPAPALPRGAGSVYVPPPPTARVLWPASAVQPPEAEAALVRVLAGHARAGDALDALAAGVAGGLSELERVALGEAPIAVDPGPIRAAAVMRVRVASARASAPAAGAEVDGAAVQALLAEMDALLAGVNALAAEAPPELLPGLEAVRNGLVREAIDFSELAQRVATRGAAAAVAAARPPARAAQARVLSTSAQEAPRRSWVPWVLLALAALGAAGYHGWRYQQRQQYVAGMRTLPGAPDGMMLVPAPPGGPQLLIPLGGKRPDPAQVERFRALQQERGFQVRSTPGGGLEIRPVPDGPPGGSTP